MSHQFQCHFCKRRFPHQPGAGLYCSIECEKKDKALHERIGKQLEAKGFKRHKEAPNLYQKDGVGVTTHEVKHHGFKETLAKHAAAVASAT